MRRFVAALAVALMAVIGLVTSPASAENFFDCEGEIILFCPGPVP